MANLSSSRKAGISPWISWVLIMTFAVLLASTVSYWMKDYVLATVDDLKLRAQRTEYCDIVGIHIDDLTAENAQTLNIKVINTYDLAVNRIIFRLYDLNDYILINYTNITIKPGQNKTISIPKNLTTYYVEALPVIIDGDKEIICNDKMVWKNLT